MEEKKDYAKVIETFVKDHSQIYRWFLNLKNGQKEIPEMYEVIKTMWFDYRDLFPNKGTYKTVRRLFIKWSAVYYAEDMRRWRDLPVDLFQEIIFKARQKWLPYCFVEMIVRYVLKSIGTENEGPQREHLIALRNVYRDEYYF